jgi:hypothetical protein
MEVEKIKLRGLRPPFQKQLEVLHELFRPQPDRIKQIDLCCGRGFGKTFLSIIAAVKALSIDGNQTGLFLEPDWDTMDQTFFPAWEDIVPEKYYTINQKKRLITWFNGSRLFYGVRAVTGSLNRKQNKFRGRNLSFVIDDEAAIGCDKIQYSNTLGAIRRGENRFYFTISTPLVGAYKRLISGKRHRLFRGTSHDNPYLPPNYVEDLMENMSPEQVRREIDGEFISLEGKIWKRFLADTPWPDGNRNDQFTTFDPGRPWYLFCDIGSATGSYIVVQNTEPLVLGHRVFKGPLWVAVAEFCPNNDASAVRAFGLLKENFGRPIEIVGGADINSRNSVTGETVSQVASEIWSNVRVTPSSEQYYKKQIQFDALNGGICKHNGTRRFTIARDFINLSPESMRGLNEMWEEDEYLPIDKQQSGHFLPKGHDCVVQHVRDALLMGAVETMFRPNWLPSSEHAA